MGKGRVYTAEFREQAMKLAKDLGSASEAARELGIPIDTLHNWRWRASKSQPPPRSAVPSSPALVDLEEENRRLRRENERLNKINEILKRATALFSQDHLK